MNGAESLDISLPASLLDRRSTLGREGLICEVHDQLIVQERAPAETLGRHFMVQSLAPRPKLLLSDSSIFIFLYPRKFFYTGKSA